MDAPNINHTDIMKKWLPWTTAIAGAVGACIFALFAGNASQNLAQFSVQIGGPSFLREPINAGIALLLLLMWQRWRPLTRFSPPKWGHVPIGLGSGLLVGVTLPGCALLLLAATGQATIKPPAFDLLLLLAPLALLVLHGFAEESLIRGIAQRGANHAFGPIAGVVWAALTFAALQALQGYASIWHIINSLLFGASLGFLVLRGGGIWTAVGAHAGWSWLELVALGQADQIQKADTWLAGTGSDSYGSPVFACVLVCALALQLVLHLQIEKRKGS